MAKEFSKDTALHLQNAALCWQRRGANEIQFLIVTSRETGRWIIPKGWPVEGLSAGLAAAREAFEEAGVEGIVADLPLGTFQYDKVLDRQSKLQVALPCEVEVFALEVTRLHDAFPEAGLRSREWVSRAEACSRVGEPSLCLLIAGFIDVAP